MSCDPEYTLPSGATASEVTKLVCPTSVRRWVPSSPDHILMVLSDEPE
jgi:hypothetical protein